MKEYRVGVQYDVYGYVTVQAENEEQAYRKALKCDCAEVGDKDYIDGSWYVDKSNITEIDHEAGKRAAMEFWKYIRDEARREWKSWANDSPEGKTYTEMHRRRERFLRGFCANYHGAWDGASSIATFHSKQGVCEIYVDNSWVEGEGDPEIRMGSTVWHRRPDGVYKIEALPLFSPSLENDELTIETEKEVK